MRVTMEIKVHIKRENIEGCDPQTDSQSLQAELLDILDEFRIEIDDPKFLAGKNHTFMRFVARKLLQIEL